MHIHFLLKNIFGGVVGADFFGLYTPYRFSRDVALDTLILGVSCVAAIVIGYIISKCTLDKRSSKSGEKFISEKYINKAIWYLNIFLALQIGFSLYWILTVGFNYSALFNLKMAMSFMFNLRMVPLLLVGFIYLNVPPTEWMKGKRLKISAILLILYFILSILLQARSAIFEFAMIIVFSWLMWHGNKIKIKYIVVFLCAMIVPNLIVLPRLNSDLDWETIITGIFSFEYTVLLSNMVSAAIDSSHTHLGINFLLRLPSLLVPSPIRNATGLGIPSVVGDDYYWNVLADSGVWGGGFSMIADLYINLGWWAILIFAFLGFLIGKFIKGAARLGRVNLLYATAPLMYAAFLINLRNDFGTFAKYSIQLILLAIILKFILRIRWVPLGSATKDGQRMVRIDATTVNDSHIGASTDISPEHSVQ